MLTIEHLYEINEQYKDSLNVKVEEFTIGNKHLNFNYQKAILGVVNLSSDSWYRESVCLSSEQAIRRGIMLTAQGADFVDIGAESTLPHAERISEKLFDTEFCPPIPPILGGKRIYLLVKVPQNWGI
ncbi:MAG: dihydropteroate synthase [Moorea sp. SIO1G6]|uniref:dihydropteroate synthase n=1 Tax=Moorena sp. SIO1G6 TaxID=2607840 RepID=UPI0013C1F43A|nr:dihydropteroate synthase [Moorena sp. SIO1G6]NET63127.1 dihydropteroate synthase [Moorena sp. SIO1G6]